MRRVRKHASEKGVTITEVVEEALRTVVSGEKPNPARFTLKWNPVAGRTRAGVDIADRDSLYEEMGRSE